MYVCVCRKLSSISKVFGFSLFSKKVVHSTRIEDVVRILYIRKAKDEGWRRELIKPFIIFVFCHKLSITLSSSWQTIYGLQIVAKVLTKKVSFFMEELEERWKWVLFHQNPNKSRPIETRHSLHNRHTQMINHTRDESTEKPCRSDLSSHPTRKSACLNGFCNTHVEDIRMM
jgi:hypothetical protein